MYRNQIAVKESGIVPEHAAQFSVVAQQNNQFILFRKVEKWATGLIKENFSTKNLHVKGKSSTWGPQAGLICCDQSLSKLHGSPTVPDFNQKVKDSLEHGFALEAPLVISKQRMMDLAKLGAIDSVNQGKDGRWIVKVNTKQETFHLLPTAVAEAEQKAAVNRFPRGNGLYVFREVTVRNQIKDQKLVTVLANERRLPLTADYDVFAICPHLSTGGYDGANLSGAAKFRAAVGAVRSALGQADRRTIDPDLGRMTATQRRTKDLLNAAAQAVGYTGGNVVHHGTEVDNPVTEMDFPVTIFVPGASRGIYGAENQLELENLVRDMLRAGYAFYGNRLWQTRTGAITPGRSIEQSKMTREWDTSLDANSAMTVLAPQDVS